MKKVNIFLSVLLIILSIVDIVIALTELKEQ